MLIPVLPLFFLLIAEGMLACQIMDRVPLVTTLEDMKFSPPDVQILTFTFTLMGLGLLYGILVRHQDPVIAMRRMINAYTVSIIGLTSGFLFESWPINWENLSTRLVQLAVVHGALLCFFGWCMFASASPPNHTTAR